MQYSFLFVFVSSFASVLVQKLYLSIPSTFTLLIISIIATIYFNIINIGKLRQLYTHCWQQKKLWLAIMITILIMWYCSMTGPGVLGASLYRFLYFAWLGALGFLSLAFKGKNIARLPLCCSLFALALILVLLSDYLYYHALSYQILITICLPIVGGTTSFIYFKQSQALTKKTPLSATQVLAIRFYLTIVLLGALLPMHNVSNLITANNFVQLTILATLSLIIPLYCIQKALETISSEYNAIIVSLAPVLTAVIQELAFKDVDFRYMVIYALYTLMLVVACIFNRNPEKNKGNTYAI